LLTLVSNGCIDSISKTILVLEKPRPAFTFNNDEQCLNENEFISINTTIPSIPEVSYAWYFNDSLFNGKVNTRFKVKDSGSYIIKMIANNQGCADSLSKSIRVNQNPVSLFTIDDSTQCVNENNFTLTSRSTSADKITQYLWKLGDGNSQEGSMIKNIYKQPGKYIITHIPITEKGCTDTSENSIMVFEKPYPAFIINDTTQCITDNLFQFSNQTPDSINTNRYLWKFGDGRTSYLVSPKYQYLKPGKFMVQLLTYNYQGCRDSVQKHVYVGAVPKGITLDPVYAIINKDIPLYAREFKDAKYSWQPSQYLNFYTIKDPVFNGQKETLYNIKITTDTGCIVNDSLKVFMFKEADIYVPKAFTPNNDGTNDLLKPFLVGIKDFKYIRIFNRWGNLVFESRDANKGWDGYFKGVKQPMETYTWIAEGIDVDGITIKRGGNFLMIR
jgi:gliding motility-associated-like protein